MAPTFGGLAYVCVRRDRTFSAVRPVDARQLTVDGKDDTDKLMDMLLAKKRSADRREWLEEKGNLADVQI